MNKLKKIKISVDEENKFSSVVLLLLYPTCKVAGSNPGQGEHFFVVKFQN